MIKKSHRKGIVAGLLAVAIAAGGVFFIRNSVSKKAVEVYPASALGYSASEEGTTLEGEVTDSAIQEIKRANGLIDSVMVKVGSQVKKGDVLLKYNKESVKLAVEADEASIALLQAQIESANAEISRLQSLHSSEEMPEPYEQVIHHTADPVATLSLIDLGTAASEGGNRYFCTKDTLVTAAMLQNLDDTDQTAVFVIYENNVEIGSWKVDGTTMTSGTKIIYIEKEIVPTVDPDQPDDPSESEEGTDDESPDAEKAEEPEGSEGASSGSSSGSGSDLPTGNETRREEAGPYEDWTLGDGVDFSGDGTVSVDYSKKHYGTLTSVIPEEAEWDETIIVDPGVDISGDDYSYSRKELSDMISEKEKEIKTNELSLKEAELKLKEDKLVSTDGKVLAAMDGVVTEVKDPSEVKTGEKLLAVKGNEGYTITVNISEYLIRNISVGDKLQVNALESQSYFEAEVTSVSLEPSDSRSGSNKNMTYYPVVATALGEDLELKRGEYCEVSINSDTSEADTLCIAAMFIRKDDQGSYCMVADENDRLKKVYVQTGKTFWGSPEILSGISMDDRIAFPYGKNVKEGSPVVDKESIYE